MKSLVIGAGEVGSAIFEIVRGFHEAYLRDIEPLDIQNIEVLHICYPDSYRFVDITKDYIEQYKPLLTIVHSSVKIGTTEQLGNDVIYSPVRGRHPYLVDEIRIYEKFISGFKEGDLNLAEEYFEKCGLKVIKSYEPRTLELCKLISNIHMGLEVAWRREVEKILGHFDCKSLEYEMWEKTYQKGYLARNQFNLVRSIMKTDPIGGHCIIPCTEILNVQFPSPFFDLVLQTNKGEVESANSVRA